MNGLGGAHAALRAATLAHLNSVVWRLNSSLRKAAE